MKNLNVFNHELIDFDANVVGQCIDADNGILFILTEDFTLFKTKNHSNQREREVVEHDFDPIVCEIGRVESNDVKLFEFVVENGCILIALKTGYLISIGVSSFSLPSKCIYKHKNQISSIKLSPDQDLIALADEENNIFVLSNDCDILYRSNASTQTNSLHKPVGVGWGSRETQFFGLDGRPSKEQQLKQQVNLSPDDLASRDILENSDIFQKFRQSQEKCTVIDWRGDGQYISTLTYFLDSNKHCLKVWNRKLELQYMSEQLVTVERGLLAWVPNGQYVCCAQRRDQGVNEIAMFEKNGMVHQRLTLPTMLTNLYTKDVAWSLDSKILAVMMYRFSVVNGKPHCIPTLMLYTMQNFHYYLKFSSCLDGDCDFFLRWDPLKPNRLHLVSSRGRYSQYICSSETTYATQYSTVAVVDANKVLITPFEICNIPPPMSAIVIESTSLISRMVMNPLRADNVFILTLDNKLIYTNSNSNITSDSNSSVSYHLEHHVAAKLYNKLENYHIVDLPDAMNYENLTPLDGLLLAATKSTSRGCDVLLLKLPVSSSTMEVEVKILTTIEGNLILAVSRDTIDKIDGIAVILDNGSCLWIDLLTGESKLLFRMQAGSSIHGYNMINLQTIRLAQSSIVVTLTQDLSLRLNSDVMIANSCTSFRATEHYLVYTTTDNNIHFTLIERLLDKSKANYESWTQQIESSATLVIVNELESKVVLQMPRGNLEILHPRLLVFSLLTDLLDEGKYVEAIKMARRHRINMNFLCDYLFYLCYASDQSEYTNNRRRYLSKFTLDIANHDASMLCLFLTELNDEDTIGSRYKNLMRHLPKRRIELQESSTTEDLGIPENKLEFICRNWLKQENHGNNKIKPTLICHIRLKQLSDALHLIQELNTTHRKEALKFMLYFVDIDQLFREALGTYDTEITLMVAAESNKDPKEYLVLLDELNKIEGLHLRSYHIDMHLKRYDKALENLAKIYRKEPCEDLKKKILDLIVSKRLYKQALTFFNTLPINDLIEPTWKKYADYLLEKRCYAEAGLAYSKALEINPIEEHFKTATRSYLLADEYDRGLALITRFGLDQSISQESLKQIIRQLVERDRCQEACIILRDLLSEKEVKEFSYDLVKRGHWHLVDFILRDDLRKDLRIDMGSQVLEYSIEHDNRVSFELSVADKQFKRLKELLTDHEERANTHVKSEGCFIDDSLSTVDGSELSSAVSDSGRQRAARSGISSIKTRNSSKTTKSQTSRKKRINLKPGSSHEDIALVIELKNFLLKQRTNQEEAMKISSALFDYCEHQKAEMFSRKANELLKKSFRFAKDVLELLWPINPHVEQKYSLYRRFSNALSPSNGCYENVDFEILIRPKLPTECILFEL